MTMKNLTFGLIFFLVLGASQFAVASLAEAASCGGLNQQACKKFPNPLQPACQQWLHDVKGVCHPCGGQREQACPILAKGPPCKPPLSTTHGVCVTKEDAGKIARISSQSKQHAQKWKPLINQMVALLRRIGNSKTKSNVSNFAKAHKPERIRDLINQDPTAPAVAALMRQLGFNSMTLGIESSVSFVGGYARETGGSFETDLHTPGAKLYATNSFFGGIIANVGNDLVISAYTAHYDQVGGQLIGAVGSFDIATGVGVTIWYNTRTFEANGVSVNIGIGNIGGGGAFAFADTKVY
jgi:hypothetical protein